MTVYLVIATPTVGSSEVIDTFERCNEAKARKEIEAANYPAHEGWSVAVLKKHVSPAGSTAIYLIP